MRAAASASIVVAGVAAACAAACVSRHPEQVPGPAPLPPLPGHPDANVAALAIDAAPPPVVLTFAPVPWGKGDRYRVELDETLDGKDAKDVTAVVIDTPEPAQIAAMIDERAPDPEHAVGTSCMAQLTAEGPSAAGTGVACTLAARRLAALLDLASVAHAPRTAGDHADAIGRVPLDLIGATPTKTSAVLESFLPRGRVVLAVTAEGTRAGRTITLRGRITVDLALTTATGQLEGKDTGPDGDARSLAVFVDLGPAD